MYADIEPAGLLESYKVASPPLMLNGTSEILDDRMSSRLRTWLPTPYCKHNMFQVICSLSAFMQLSRSCLVGCHFLSGLAVITAPERPLSI